MSFLFRGVKIVTPGAKMDETCEEIEHKVTFGFKYGKR